MNDICSTCLSTDRRLIPLQEIKEQLHTFNFLELKMSTNAVCWECWSILHKFHIFKKRTQTAQNILSQNTQNTNIKSLSTLTYQTLSCDYEYNFDTDPLTRCENIPKAETDLIKQELIDENDDNIEYSDADDSVQKSDFKDKDIIENIYIEEINTNINKSIKPEKIIDNLPIDNSLNEPQNVYVETIDTKPTKEFVNTEINKKRRVKSKKVLHKTHIKENESENKFVKVVLSEEEMIKLREEKRNHHNYMKLPFKCDSCVLGFMREETYNLHVKKKHDPSIGNNICKVCNIRFPSKLSLTKHYDSHYVRYSCLICTHVVHELSAAVSHCRVKHADDTVDRIHCHQCSVVVRNAKELEEHVQSVHTLYCNECGEKFKGKDTLRRHKARTHSAKREFICDICTRSFNTKKRLETHMAKHNENLAKKLAYCSVCKVQYKNIFIYRSHLRTSTNHAENVYPCPVCKKKFASKLYCRNHYNFYHLRKSKFKCEICNKLFISDWRVKCHKQIHHGLSRTRDHPCNICNKKFYTLAMLRMHKLIHSDQRSYMCADCGDTFKQSASLYTHIKLVHKGGGRKK
ncbi:zinc finger protein 557-like [Helicoverpa armigera]|uniref:zinc finger protein 557-like n=1 Tax=Helicoverpa armigera TaxID=29058 RepID=UPI0030830D9B